MLAIEPILIYGIVAKRPACELGLSFAGCFITKSRKDDPKGHAVCPYNF